MDGAPDHLSEDEKDFLDRHSGTVPSTGTERQAVERSAADAADLWRSALSTRSVARMLGVPVASVHALTRTRRLYVLIDRERGESRYPAWQFMDGRVLPHLAEVLHVLPSAEDPLATQAFFTNARVEQPDERPAVPVRTWLTTGGDPSPVVALVLAEREG